MSESVKQKRADEFSNNFSKAKNLIVKRIDDLTVDDPARTGELASKLTLISNDIQQMSSSLNDATLFLPSYSIKTRQDELRVLEQALTDKENELVPKKKFGFKPRAAPAKTAAEKKDVTVDKADIPKEASLTDNANFLTIENTSDDVLTYEDSQLHKNDVLIRNLENVKVYLNGSPSSLRLSKLKNCTLVCGPVFTSVFIEECKDCVIFVCCQQLRTHTSEGLDVYLRVRARAIIEDCTKIRFAPYTWTHENSSELHRLTGMDENLESFDCIDDFNWLAFSTPSPNWSVLPEDERVKPPVTH